MPRLIPSSSRLGRWLRFGRSHVRLEIAHAQRLLRTRIPGSKLRVQQAVGVLFAGAVAVGAAQFVPEALPREARLMAGIFVLAALLWTTEALPLFATALLVIALEVVLLANPGDWPGLGFTGAETPPYQTFLAPLASPIIYLFLGGFIVARAAVKEGVDASLASLVLRLFQGRPRLVMLGLMIATATFSMFMSNTATTAMMITLVGPMLVQIPKDDPVRRGLLLSVPFAANIGGMGTPVASPPNAVALGVLAESGLAISFGAWMLIAVPLGAVLLVIAWLLIQRLYPAQTAGLHLQPITSRLTGRGYVVLAVALSTIALWLAEPWHGLPTAVVALLPVVAFTSLGVLNRYDFDALQWNVLVLIAGGLALGVGMRLTGLDVALVQALPTGGATALLILTAGTLVLSTFMSNTAAANLVLPIGISLAMATGDPASGIEVALCIALVASSAMALPVSTPPNAIAYAQGELTTRDMVMAGTIVSLLALALIAGLGPFVIGYWIR
ncbi:MAG: DASS family sodium-coupled anion symporter [Bacteroidota bacterium]